MNEWTDDVTDLVRDADPMPGSRAAGWSRSEEGAAVEAEVGERLEADAPPTRSRRPRRVALLLAATLALTAVVASAVGVIATSESATRTVSCWIDEGPRANIAFLGIGERTPVEACVAEWPNVSDDPVPSTFAVCTLSDGSWGVIPNDDGEDPADVCGRNGGSPAD